MTKLFRTNNNRLASLLKVKAAGESRKVWAKDAQTGRVFTFWTAFCLDAENSLAFMARERVEQALRLLPHKRGLRKAFLQSL